VGGHVDNVLQQPDIAIFFGRPIRSQRLAERLREKGFRVTVYDCRGQKGTYVPVKPNFVAALGRALTTNHQIYFTHYTSFPGLCLYLNRVMRGTPYVFNAVGLMSATYRDRSLRWPWPRAAETLVYPTMIDLLLRGAARIVCNSRHLRHRLMSEFPRYASKMTTVYNSIDGERFASGPTARHHTDRKGINLVSVMSWDYTSKASAAKLIIDAMRDVVASYPRARLTIAAKTTHRRHASANEAYLADKPWRASINVIYNSQDIPALLASSDVFVYATPDDSNDSLPRALLEAHAAGLPIVTTATAGCSEIVEDGVTGFTVPYDAEAFGRRVVELLADPNRCKEMGTRGQTRIHDVFSWERMAEGYANVFLEIARGAAHA
jgi:glycosyltransferase involved in cell wall biosynthesis